MEQPFSIATDAFPITPGNSEILPPPFALYVGGKGDVQVETSGGNQVTFKGVPAGSFLPIKVDKVLSGGTTATDIIGVY